MYRSDFSVPKVYLTKWRPPLGGGVGGGSEISGPKEIWVKISGPKKLVPPEAKFEGFWLQNGDFHKEKRARKV